MTRRPDDRPDPFPVLFRDNRFIVIDKPPGLPVHPGPSGGPSVEDSFPLLSRRADGPWLAHRLDRDTSGCLLIALRKQALLAAQAAFAAGQVRKTYWAVVQGRPAADSGTVAMTMARHSDRQGWRMVAAPDGQASRTDWRVLASDGRESWLELHLLTGRTHQARLHCASLGCPILGDPVYGGAEGPTLHLMSRHLALPLSPPVSATAPPPAHIRATLDRHGWQGIGAI
ncbi:pseudouridine synthase [Gluconacetobacter diazotrophicus PA1 5]|uniref:RNA pseudouridine synthase n=2 Tax=Gluconacetobacter diazotrophicus TaxID=33996 RepID=A0A7W4I8Y4_GLUDI|nr:RNA pseudouridine synthase [Gluconacetobacter diazotrophicus]ACI51766.1 pseudouridine synthase [Gluconacetobacter diazotrophicus PA1 5]MBB2158499.1 RNA pseudouridine synthase [Gluconacetobacter diazotrophicus]TWB11110.1 tRNA pseudouridine32 synthase/23S rRNA pseudouridine746 synthase [Gluconacetobacter diazotrophicus]CAP55240.1 putative RNA pseudouridine synthase [Gluconacetobacter diazotrophicus PA1 5]